MKNILLLLALFISFIGCGDDSSELFRQKNSNYSIWIESFVDKDAAIDFVRNLNEDINKNAYIIIDSSKGIPDYNVMVGDFTSSLDAGKSAYKLFGKHDKKYVITHEGKIVEDDYMSFLYIDNFRGIPAVYKINIGNGKPEVIWKKANERVVKLNFSPDKETAFFITASGYGRKEFFPYIDNLKIYHCNIAQNKFTLAYNFGSGVQVYSYREDPGNYRVIFNRFKDKSLNFVTEHSVVFNVNGNIISDQKKTYDIIKENYPLAPEQAFNLISSEGRYRITDSSDTQNNKYYFLSWKNNSKLLLKTKRTLNDIEWSNSGQFAAFTTHSANGNGSNPDSLIILDIDKKNLIGARDGHKIGNIIWKEDIIFFTSKSTIRVLDIKRNTVLFEYPSGKR